MALFLRSFELLQEYRKIKPFRFEFRDGLNIIVGENGSGKSSVLHLLTSQEEKEKELRKIKAEECSFRYFDTEKHNPRKEDFNYSKIPMFSLNSRFISHGETIFALINATKEFKDTVVIIDEPEAGVSLKNQLKIVQIVKKGIKNGCQFVIVTHSYPIIKSAKEVFSMDIKKWISSEEYLATVLK